MNPGALVIIRDDHVHNSPNHALRQFRADAARAIRDADLDLETTATVWAIVLTADNWDALAGWIRSALRH